MPLEIRQLIVQEGGRERIVLVPLSGDRAWDEYLLEGAEELTRERLRKLPPKTLLDPATREEAAARMREFARWVRWKRAGGQVYQGG